MSFQQAQQEGLCLRYPENFGHQASVNYDTAVNMLLRAIPLSQQVPYSWGFIDKPPEGQVILLFLSSQSPYPIDGIRFQDQETRFVIPVGSTRELEVTEAKFGFIPNSQDTVAWRVRRRFRLHKGGHPQLVLVHYTRGPTAPISPGLMNLPVRSYPLRQVNEPSVYVLGDKAGKSVYPHPPGSMTPGGGGGGGSAPAQAQAHHQGMPPGSMPPGAAAVGGAGGGREVMSSMSMNMGMGMGMNMGNMGMGMGNMNMNMHTQKAMLAQQNSTMEALERRRERERARERGVGLSSRGQGIPQPPHPPQHRPAEDDDSADEAESISTRTLATTRYKRNHELMDAIFCHAAFGDKNQPSRPSPYSIFNPSELEEKAAKLEIEIEAMRRRAADRAAAAAAAAEKMGAEQELAQVAVAVGEVVPDASTTIVGDASAGGGVSIAMDEVGIGGVGAVDDAMQVGFS